MCGFGNVRTHGDDVRRQTAHFCAVVDSGTILAEAERHIHRQKERKRRWRRPIHFPEAKNRHGNRSDF